MHSCVKVLVDRSLTKEPRCSLRAPGSNEGAKPRVYKPWQHMQLGCNSCRVPGITHRQPSIVLRHDNALWACAVYVMAALCSHGHAADAQKCCTLQTTAHQ